MSTERGLDRLIFFTDAVAAIAITLLILPLVDDVPKYATAQHPIEQFLHDDFWQLFAFALSFLIIARLWLANHEIFEHVERATLPLMWLELAWSFTVVVIPLPTEIVAAYKSSLETAAIYIGWGFLGMFVLTAMAFYLYRHPDLHTKDKATSLILLWGVGSTAAGFGLALVIVLIFPFLTYYPLLLLLLTYPLDWILKPRIRRRAAAQ